MVSRVLLGKFMFKHFNTSQMYFSSDVSTSDSESAESECEDPQIKCISRTDGTGWSDCTF